MVSSSSSSSRRPQVATPSTSTSTPTSSSSSNVVAAAAVVVTTTTTTTTTTHHHHHLRQSIEMALRGGTAGALAMFLQVICLMWLRTVINYQYAHGDISMIKAMTILYKEGGIGRFYQGSVYALLQGPLSRFGDTAANEGIRTFFHNTKWSISVITLLGSISAALWRMVLTPLDTIKTTLQVSGSTGMDVLRNKIRQHGIFVLYDGAIGNWGANVIGHYPWFVVNNALEKIIPKPSSSSSTRQAQFKVIRRALIGCCSAIVSDCCSNGVRVLKTYKQTSNTSLTYVQALQHLIAESGVLGFMLRGLGVKLLSNVISSILFSILWKMIMEKLQERQQIQQLNQQKLADKKSDISSYSSSSLSVEASAEELQTFIRMTSWDSSSSSDGNSTSKPKTNRRKP